MKPLLAIALLALTGCGSLDNEPLRFGVIRGQLLNTDSAALVAVVGRDDLVTQPDLEGRFELKPVPLGPAELLVVINAREARRITVEVGAASVVELGEVTPAPSAHFEVYVDAPGGQRVNGGTVALLATPFIGTIRGFEDEAEFRVPPGCYDALVTVAGLGTQTVSGCVEAGLTLEKIVTMLEPDGSPGREGCPVSGCQGLLVCQADRSCR
ncbi:MAG: hypothetical protein Q8L48_39515 [Archangium sp.]|nr:hypothetical protein [Archangium sp.]